VRNIFTSSSKTLHHVISYSIDYANRINSCDFYVLILPPPAAVLKFFRTQINSTLPSVLFCLNSSYVTDSLKLLLNSLRMKFYI
jgi:hypothetical protein